MSPPGVAEQTGLTVKVAQNGCPFEGAVCECANHGAAPHPLPKSGRSPTHNKKANHNAPNKAFHADRSEASIVTFGRRIYGTCASVVPTSRPPSDLQFETPDCFCLTRTPDPFAIHDLRACCLKQCPPTCLLDPHTPSSHSFFASLLETSPDATGLASATLFRTIHIGVIHLDLLPLPSFDLARVAATLVDEKNTKTTAKHPVPKVPASVYIHQTHPVRYTPSIPSAIITTSTCISNHRPALRLRSRSQSASRQGACLLPPLLSTATSPHSRARVVAHHVPTHHGRRDHLWTTAVHHHPTSATPTSLARTLTTSLPAHSLRRLQHHHARTPWPRHSPSCPHSTPRRSPRRSVVAAVAASNVAHPSR